MIVYTVKGLRIYETRSDKPNEDWTGKADFVVDETDSENQELINKIKEYAPYFDYVTNLIGELVDVEKTGEMTFEPEPDPVAELQNEVRTLKAQNQALTESNQFLEDCIVEMAEIVYA